MRQTDQELLKEILMNDIMTQDMSEYLFMKKKEKVLNVHDYAITEPKTSKGKWQTYVKTDNGRKKLTYKSENTIIDKLYSHYYVDNKLNLRELYPQWIKRRKSENLSDRTIKRNDNHWQKYYVDHEIITTPLAQINATLIEDFLYSMIREHDMTVKELNNMKIIIKDILKMAKRNGYIEINPYNDVEIKTYSCRPPKKHSDQSKVYLPNEKERLFIELNKEIQINKTDTDAFAIFLLFKLGLRIGEVVALKEKDIENGYVHIHRMETRKADLSGDLKITVVNHTKKKSSYGDRYLPLGEYELDLIHKVKKINRSNGYYDQGYLFLDKNGRTKIREIDNRIRKMCRQANIPEKSAHDIRRTVASEMYANGLPVEIIRDFLGHSDIKTTYGYIYDNNTKEETARMIEKALADMNGCKIS